MMSYIDAIILGVVQGITEFLPISSSGHLIIVRDIFTISISHVLVFDVLLHIATLFAIFVYFYKDIIAIAREIGRMTLFQKGDTELQQLTWALLIGTLPAGVVGFFFHGFIESVIRNPVVVIYALLFGSGVFIVAEYYARMDTGVTVRNGLGVGLFQVLAFIPGISRSGITIAGGLLHGMNRVDSARFSFLLGIPVIIGAGLKIMLDITEWSVISYQMLAGSFVAFLVGLLSIIFLMRFLRTQKLHMFVLYRIVLAVVLIIFTLS